LVKLRVRGCRLRTGGFCLRTLPSTAPFIALGAILQKKVYVKVIIYREY
jgi:hypothetical protein